MEEDLVAKIVRDPRYQELKSKRSSFGWTLTIAMLIVYYGFIVLVAFDKERLFKRIGEGVTTLGMPIGVAVILFTIIITAVYVRRANAEFDRLSAEVVKGALK